MPDIRIGLIGCGGIANGSHIPSYAASTGGRIVAVCDINDERLNRTGDRLNIPAELRFKDYHDLIACDQVDAVDICTPNYLHCPIAMEAVKAHKPFSCEKPLGMNYKETVDLMNAAKAAGVPGFICLSWRYRAIIRYLKSLVDEGKIGKLRHIYIRCIKDSGIWENRPLEWRFQKDLAGTGVLCDLGSHMFDLLRFMGEEIDHIYAEMGIVYPERPLEDDPTKFGKVTTDDWVNLIAMTESGANLTFQISRTTTGVSGNVKLELYGEKGMLIFDEAKPQLEFCTDEYSRARKRSQTVFLETPDSFKTQQSQAFIDMVNGNTNKYTATLDMGVADQKIIDAAVLSATEHRVVKLSEIQ